MPPWLSLEAPPFIQSWRSTRSHRMGDFCHQRHATGREGGEVVMTRTFRRTLAVSLPRLGAVVLGVVVSPGLGLAAGQVSSSETPAQVTFTKDVAPILQRTCQNCHRPNGGLAPMALTTYEEVRPWAKAIKLRTSRREMPPWFIEKNIGIQQFKDDFSLSDAEIATIGKWVDSGAPRGNPADMPPPRQFTDINAWNIGEPDLIIDSPMLNVEAEAGDWHSPYVGATDTGLTEDRWIAAFEVKE